ncbi:MAG: ribonuclease HII [Thiomicrorhabdus sp.]|nr:ribonuclease HII [Thiomicrorhabdus sp.]
MSQKSLFSHELLPEFFSLTGTTVGVDEVGRGPLIGDVVASAVILPKDCQLPLRDSKKLTESKRQALAEQIKQQAVAYAITFASPEEIDQLNILNATMLAMQRAVQEITDRGHEIQLVYVDGNRCPKLSCTCQSVVKGDDKVMEISAASILAKVFRDQQMYELHQKYPQYGFNEHKGYPTAKHLSALKEFGMIPGYRKSFKPVKALLDVNAL